MNTAWPDTVGEAPPFGDHPDRNCNGLPTDAFYPPRHGTSEAHIAKRVCHRCPLEQTCLDWAVDHYETGVWGGTSDTERAVIRRRRASRLTDLHTTRIAIQRRSQVAALTDQHLTARQIAERVGISDRAVQRHQAATRKTADPADGQVAA
jgi:WhiB family transcriptional regulator, redox-sensing transcriptional regulator